MRRESRMMNAGISIKLSEGVRAAHKSRAASGGTEKAAAAEDAEARAPASIAREITRGPRAGEKGR